MKKTILFYIAAIGSVSAFSQSPMYTRPCTQVPANIIDRSKEATTAVVKTTGKTVASNPKTLAGGISVHLIGSESNALGTNGDRQYLWVDPSTKTVVLTHRYKVGTNTGYLAYDISKDNGATWPASNLNMGPVYSPDGDPLGANYSVARYPQGVIYNPVGNTIADSAFQVYFAATRDNSNPNAASSGDWGGYGFGSCKLGGLPAPTSHQVHSAGALYHYIPTDMTITKQGVVWVLDANRVGTNGYDMNDSLIVTKGVWNASKRDFDFISKNVYTPVSITGSATPTHPIASSRISFADDGMTGYISTIQYLDPSQFPMYNTHNIDSAYGIVVHKTTDGGNTWGPATYVDVTDVDTFLLHGHYRYTAGFDHDAVVDGAGNLHMTLAIGHFTPLPGTTANPSTGFAIDVARGHWGIFDVFTTDKGTSWKGKLLAQPQTFSGVFGPATSTASDPSLTEYNRAQASREYTSGKQVFFTWFDSDSSLTSGTNTFPNMFSIGFDINSGKWTNVKNFTAGSSVDGKVVQGAVSYYTISPSPGTYTIPCAFSAFQGADPTKTGSPIQLNYIDSAQFVTADFNNGDDSYPLTTYVAEYKNNDLSISQNYPNPFSNQTMVDVSLQKSSDLSIIIYNPLGEVVASQLHKAVAPGFHTFTMDATGLAAGIYIYTIRSGDSAVTRKMTVK
jgi:hypothetical protein